MKKNFLKWKYILLYNLILLLVACNDKISYRDNVNSNQNNGNYFVNSEENNNNVETVESEYIDEIHYIRFNNDEVFLDNNKVNEYNYAWHIDSKGDYDEVKDSPAEYYTGDKPNEKDSIWIAHDIKYFPLIDKNKFYKSDLRGNPEWNTRYENEKYKNLVFASLPRSLNDDFPDYMMHSEKEAFNNPCLHITLPGTYELSGKWNGQVFVDLGKKSEIDSSKKINFILNNVEINCSVAPAINIYQAYECDSKWEERKESTSDIDFNDIGVKIILKDNSKNYVNGANVYRICKTIMKKNGKEQKKAVKFDGAINTATSLSFNGEVLNNGELYINSTLEGISADLHLLFNGGNIYINADNDGINCKEDNVSVLKINDGILYVNSGLGYEGDGIDSNGYIIVNGGDVISVANYELDPGIDSVNGIYINGGSVVALGEQESLDWAKIYMNENNDQSYIFKSFDDVKSENSILMVIDEKGNDVYTFSQKFFPHISSKARKFRGIFISNYKINKNMEYDIIEK